jgi:hypothetical protein
MGLEESEVIADAIREAFVSDFGPLTDAVVDSFMRGGPNCDVGMVDTFIDLAYHTKQIASAITPVGVAGSLDATGGHVTSLTEAVMGATAGLVQIANAIQALAEAVNAKK